MNDADLSIPPDSSDSSDTTTGEPDVDAMHHAAAVIADAVRGCPSVAGLHPGDHDRTRTDHPAREPVLGVRLDLPTVVVGVVGYYPTRVVDLARAVRHAVHALHPDADVTVCVEDMLPGGPHCE